MGLFIYGLALTAYQPIVGYLKPKHISDCRRLLTVTGGPPFKCRLGLMLLNSGDQMGIGVFSMIGL